MDPEIRQVVKEFSSRLVAQGAKATLLTGSHARGQARPDSDVDIFAVGDGPSGWMEIVGGRLVAVYWWNPEEIRRRMLNPESALLAVRAWREGVLVDDPTGVGAELQREAHEWTWEKIEREADAWVADKLVVWSEYVQKMASALDAGRRLDAAATRAQLTTQLAELFAVRRRLMEQSENGFWESVAEAGGPEWRGAIERALLDGDDTEAAAGAVGMFTLLVDDAHELLDARQRDVIEHALDAARSAAPRRAA